MNESATEATGSEPVVMVRVRNHRAGALAIPAHVLYFTDAKPMPRAAVTFEPGDTVLDLDVLNMLPDALQDEMAGWVNSGWLEMLPADLPPAAEPAPEAPTPDPSGLPADDAGAIAAISNENDAAKLDQWFLASGPRLPVAEAILKRLTELDRK